MAALVLVTVATGTQFTGECFWQASPDGSCQSPRVHDETLSVRVGHATTSSCFFVLNARCQVVSLSRMVQTRCRSHAVPQLILTVQDVREAFEPCAAHEHRDMAEAL